MKTTPPLILAITVALTSILGSIGARADTVILSPVDAFRILSIFPTSHDPSLLSVYNNGTDNIQHSILLFDFSSIPAGTTISSATLTLIGNGGPWSQPAGTHSDVYAVAVPWNDTSNWNAASTGVPWATPGGDVTGTPYATNALVLGPSDTIAWDVTTLVSAWTSGALTDYGLLLAATPDDTLHFDTGSPRLTLNYAPTPEPTSAALLGLGTLLLAARRRRSAQA